MLLHLDGATEKARRRPTAGLAARAARFLPPASGLALALMLCAGCSGLEAPPPEAAYNGADQSKSSPVPLPKDYGLHYQLTVQAAEHWRGMAVDVAAQVYRAYAERPDLLPHPIFVARPNNRPFSVAFYNFLRSELVARGLQVAYTPEHNAASLEYAVQSARFDPGRFERGYFGGAREIYGAWEGRASDNEIVLNARLLHNGRFVLHCSAIRYINDEDLPLYEDPQAFDPLAESRRNIKITVKR